MTNLPEEISAMRDGGAAQDVCTCAECTTGLHTLSKWLESEEQVVQHVAFLQEVVCTGDGECAGAVADWYLDMIKHATHKFLILHATPVLCSQLCDVTTGAPMLQPDPLHLDLLLLSPQHLNLHSSFNIFNLLKWILFVCVVHIVVLQYQNIRKISAVFFVQLLP